MTDLIGTLLAVAALGVVAILVLTLGALLSAWGDDG